METLTVTCPHCGAANPADLKFCRECWALLHGRLCPGCGRPATRVGALTCEYCGESLYAFGASGTGGEPQAESPAKAPSTRPDAGWEPAHDSGTGVTGAPYDPGQSAAVARDYQPADDIPGPAQDVGEPAQAAGPTGALGGGAVFAEPAGGSDRSDVHGSSRALEDAGFEDTAGESELAAHPAGRAVLGRDAGFEEAVETSEAPAATPADKHRDRGHADTPRRRAWASDVVVATLVIATVAGLFIARGALRDGAADRVLPAASPPAARTPAPAPVPATPPASAAPATTRLAPSAPPPATLSIHTVPSGAWIELDGRRVGASSLTLDGVPPGVYALRITKTGFRPVIRRIRLGPGERVALRVALAPVAQPRRPPPPPQWIVRLQAAQRPRSIPTPVARPGAVYLVTLPALAGVTQYNQLDQVVLAGVVYRRALVEYRNWWQGRSRRDREWRVVYRLGGRYARFRARAGLEDGAPPEVTASFEVRGDGVTLFAGTPKRAGDAPDVIDVDVAGVVELELVARATDPFYTRGVGVIWADPHLVPAPAGAPTPSPSPPAAGGGPARQERP